MIVFAFNLPSKSSDIEYAKTKLIRYLSYDFRSRTNFIQQQMNDEELS